MLHWSRALPTLLLVITVTSALGPAARSRAATPAGGCRPLLGIAAATVICYPPARAATAEKLLLAGAITPSRIVRQITHLQLTQVLLVGAQAGGADRVPPFALVYLFGTPPQRDSRLPCTAPSRPRYFVVAETTSHALAISLPRDCPGWVQTTLPWRNLVIKVESNLGRGTESAVAARLAATVKPTKAQTPTAPVSPPGPSTPTMTPVSSGPGAAGPGATGVVASLTPSPTTPRANTMRTITRANDGQVIALAVGETFALNLQPDRGYRWTVHIADPTVVTAAPGAGRTSGVGILFAAVAPGLTTLTATGDPACRTTYPPCELPSLTFQLQMVVH